MSDSYNIAVLESPIIVDWANWLLEHLECDTICDDGPTADEICVFAYARSKKENEELKKYRNSFFPGKQILKEAY